MKLHLPFLPGSVLEYLVNSRQDPSSPGRKWTVRTKSMKVAGKWKSVRPVLPTTGRVAANLVYLWESRFQLEQQGERQKWELGMEPEPRGPFQNHSRPLCFIKSLHHNFRLAAGIFQRSSLGRLPALLGTPMVAKLILVATGGPRPLLISSTCCSLSLSLSLSRLLPHSSLLPTHMITQFIDLFDICITCVVSHTPATHTHTDRHKYTYT